MFLFKWFLVTIKKIHPVFILLILLLQGIGLLTLYSATHGAYSSNSSLFEQQIIWISLSWLVFFLVYSIDYSFLSKMIWSLYFLHIILLILIIFFGKEIYSAKRWLDFGLFHYQPSELLKFILLILTSKYLASEKYGEPLGLEKIIKFIIFLSPPLFLTMIQPDLGTMGITLLSLIPLILFQGMKKKIFISFLIVFCISLPFAWNFSLKTYQKNRITSFIQPEKDPKGTGYNVIQSKIAIGSGQLLGKGFTKGTQNRLQFLPERHTDFIFSVLSEEYGFVGSFGTLILFFFLIIFSIRSAAQSRDRLGCFVCLSTSSFLFWHVFLNLAMIMGLFPVVGIPLPLLSYGGSHALTTMAFLGALASVRRKKDLF